MTTRREFLKGSLLTTSALAFGACTTTTKAVPQPFSGIVYTKSNPGKWSEKVGGNAPLIAVEKNRVTITTTHPMSQEHYIVRHTLVSADGKVLGEKTFYPSEPKAISTYELPEKHSSEVYATSFCNLHDLWVTEFKA